MNLSISSNNSGKREGGREGRKKFRAFSSWVAQRMGWLWGPSTGAQRAGRGSAPAAPRWGAVGVEG